MSSEQLTSILGRISVEIWLAHEALGVYAASAEAAQALQGRNFNHLFGVIQRHARDALILSVCNLFEKPNKSYPNYSVPSALAKIEDTCDWQEVTPLNSIPKLHEFIRQRIEPAFDICQPDAELTAAQLVFEYFKQECPGCSGERKNNALGDALDAVKVLRDKRVAHVENHDLEGLPQADFGGIIKLLCFAEDFDRFVSLGLFGFSLAAEARPE
ncbi:MAG: hypothetical protein JXR94_16285, partial [Candidatus Hydrogenedentes bacterium]|nr:hypothetical protein [Candidatus Hydrogenedentota bacterium]